jgi:hypothetical protein
MKIGLFTVLFLFPFYDYAQNSPIRFYPLKKWELKRGNLEVSYPLTNGTTYRMDFTNTQSGRFTLFNSKREILLTQEINGNSIIWRNTKTEICYFRFEETKGGSVEVVFNRLGSKIRTVAKMN